MGIFDFLNKKAADANPQTPKPESGAPGNVPERQFGLMSKADVEQVLLKVTIDNQEALLVKIYKNGTIVRAGMSALPVVPVSTLSEVSDAAGLWEAFMQTVPERLLQENSRQVAPQISRPFSYTIVFFGDSANGDTGEYAQWRRTQGIEIVGNLDGPYHPLHGLLEQVVVSAMRQTNDYFFDVMVLACWDLKARNMPQGMVSMGKDAQKDQVWNDFLMHLLQGPFAGDVGKLTSGKIYENPTNGQAFRLEIQASGGHARYDFIPAL